MLTIYSENPKSFDNQYKKMHCELSPIMHFHTLLGFGYFTQPSSKPDSFSVLLALISMFHADVTK